MKPGGGLWKSDPMQDGGKWAWLDQVHDDSEKESSPIQSIVSRGFFADLAT
jgi:hypothetical protein